MAFLSDVLAAAARGETVRVAVLAQFDFVGDPHWYWIGFGPLRTADGQVWEGTGSLASISGLATPIGTSAPSVTFGMSGVDARTAALARRQSSTVKGRPVRVLAQFYTGDLALLEAPVEVWSGDLDVMTYEVHDDGTYTISVTAESPWANRSKAPFGFLNDTDQQARYPGDRGLELVASLPGKAINWPS